VTLEAVAELAQAADPELRNLSPRTVLGEGPKDAPWMLIGEAPGADEDAQGKPFVGRAGRLLTALMAEAGLDRSEVYITNLVKRRPPGNRNPSAAEIAASAAVLDAEIDCVQPAVITPLGNVPTMHLLGRHVRISHAHGRWFSWRGRMVVPMFHPAYLLRNARTEVGTPRARTLGTLIELQDRLARGDFTATAKE
jgi:DNA polymerase